MTVEIFGAGVGRTGTYSLKLAINELGLGPCHHMEEVLKAMQVQVPLWNAAIAGQPDWEAIYDGFEAAVDWPTAGFFRELHAAYPDARFILTHRSPESWAESFHSTIYTLLSQREDAPEHMRDWIDMGSAVIAHTGFPAGLDKAALAEAYAAHNDAVRAAIPPGQLLEIEIKEGWAPICAFLGVPVPDTPFPRTNDRSEFWDLVAAGAG